MSRSWTPREIYCIDKLLQEKTGETLRNITNVLIDLKGNIVKKESEHDLKIRKQFKELGFLLDNLPRIYKEFSNHPEHRNKVLYEIEEHLEKLIEQDSGRADDIVWKWYIGKLDINFYYNKYNNELFYKYIADNIRKLIK